MSRIAQDSRKEGWFVVSSSRPNKTKNPTHYHTVRGTSSSICEADATKCAVHGKLRPSHDHLKRASRRLGAATANKVPGHTRDLCMPIPGGLVFVFPRPGLLLKAAEPKRAPITLKDPAGNRRSRAGFGPKTGPNQTQNIRHGVSTTIRNF